MRYHASGAASPEYAEEFAAANRAAGATVQLLPEITASGWVRWTLTTPDVVPDRPGAELTFTRRPRPRCLSPYRLITGAPIPPVPPTYYRREYP